MGLSYAWIFDSTVFLQSLLMDIHNRARSNIYSDELQCNAAIFNED